MNVLLTGATGSMGQSALNEFIKTSHRVRAFSLDTDEDKKILKKYQKYQNIKTIFGDLTKFQDVKKAVKGVDIVLHVGAFVSPAADYHPKIAMKINYGSTVNIINAIKETGQEQSTKLVYIGTVAQTGDRMPPIHWGRVGDPIKPSVFDYYAVSKIAAERAVVESGLKYWVSLRQTGMISKKMLSIDDAIVYHNCLDNILEYVSDRDSGRLLKNVCEDVEEDFWGHIYNIGGGESCRITGYNMNARIFKLMGVDDLSLVMDSKWYAIRNFHGQNYLDGDKLEKYLKFRTDSIEYMFDLQKKKLGLTRHILKLLCKNSFIKKIITENIKKQVSKNLMDEHGTMNFISNNLQDKISAYFISKEHWEKIPPIGEMDSFKNWDKVIHIDHGYDESKPEAELNFEDMANAAEFRGGKCLSSQMKKGDWSTPLSFECAFGHKFKASPRLILEGGHWCDECERESWNYHEIAKVNPFFAQVWYPLHDKNEKSIKYKKLVSEFDVIIE